jgi:hypothetical protein
MDGPAVAAQRATMSRPAFRDWRFWLLAASAACLAMASPATHRHEELARFLDAIKGDGARGDAGAQSHIFRYCVVALCTGARPAAVLDLNVNA